MKQHKAKKKHPNTRICEILIACIYTRPWATSRNFCGYPSDRALKGIWGKRRPKTLKHIALVLKRLRDALGSNAALFSLDECVLVNYLFDRADEPCGKSVPELVVRFVALAWRKWGLPDVLSDWSASVAAQLKVELSKGNLKAVRKALNYPLVVVVAAEMAIVEPNSSGLTPLELAVVGVEVVKFYLSARFHDMQNLCFRSLRWSQEFWGNEAAFRETKTTGAGCAIEVLPAWISRFHSLSGKDWAAAWVSYLQQVSIFPPPGDGYFLQDPETGGKMSYDVKLRLTREAFSKIDLEEAAVQLGLPDCPRFISPAFATHFGEHSARGVMNSWGVELGIPKERLHFLGRWTPQDSVDDYARSSRAAVMGIVKEVTDAIKSGWRPDESLIGTRAKERSGDLNLSVDKLLFGNTCWSAEPMPAADSCLDPDLAPASCEEASDEVVQARPEHKPLFYLAHDSKTVQPTTLHAAKPWDCVSAKESLCGKTMSRDIRIWTEHRQDMKDLDMIPFVGLCGGYRCKDVFKNYRELMHSGDHTGSESVEDEAGTSSHSCDS